MEALQAAVAAGADAVYMGTASFGARAEAGFSLEETRKAVEYAHLYGRKVHITVNTLCHQSELHDVRRILHSLEEIGADAVLIQDAGILRIALTEFPSLTVHASTQMTIHQSSGVRWLKEIGVSRAVLARECDLSTIRACCQEGIEIEVFVHGALCVSVSGQCGLSSWIGPRSGNRGRCAQPCRLSYSYRGQEGCWLSPADLCGWASLPMLIKAGVSSLKIEGRLKRPEYVYIVTSLYRQALNQIQKGVFRPDDPEALEALTQIFSRGQFTQGYAAGKQDRGVLYPDYAAARGILIGKTGALIRRSGGACLTELLLRKPLANGDGLRAGDQALIYSGPDVSGGKAVLRLRSPVHEGTDVWRTESEKQLSAAREACDPQTFIAAHPLPVSMELTAFPGQETVLCLTHAGVSVHVSSSPPARAESVPLTEESARRFLSKLGGTPFDLDRLCVRSQDAFLPGSALNALRREGIARLTEAVIAARRPAPSPPRPVLSGPISPVPSSGPQLMVVTGEMSEISALYQAGADQVILEPADWRTDSLARYFEQADGPFILQLPAVCPDSVLDAVLRLNQDGKVPLSLGSIGQLGAHLPGVQMAGPGVPVMNAEAEAFLLQEGIRTVTLSRELSFNRLKELPAGVCGRLLPVYGRPRLMLLSHCPERVFRGLTSGRESCSLCAAGEGAKGRVLIDQKECGYPLIPFRFDEGCRVGLYAPAPVSLGRCWSSIRKLSVSPMLSFTVESTQQRILAVRYWRSLLDGQVPADAVPGTLDRLETGVL